ncbi:MAG: Phosphoheptose isomerase [uncultured bacterium]|nr:MAG: Phosphoheptose isomerase [uncultured bacterium]OGT67698.1 MAG: phosphoheptose isomerase [Gammaproteobacteria bacterium RIFCSPLOWO2_02_FULL_38_11]OGT77257.1 MAG: phosphoheptose isomerase [Gammaproteobacteria bacterium RIFCSPLOWO2_12_FULL_38_14]
MDIVDYVKHHFNESFQIKTQLSEHLPITVANAGSLIAQSLLEGHKILCCGNGGSAALTHYFVSNMLNHFEVERPSLPALALTSDPILGTSIANDYSFLDLFSKQIRALGEKDDTLLVISTHGNDPNILRAIEAAHDRSMHVIAFTGYEGGDIAASLHPDDIELRAPFYATARIRETHLLFLHCLSGLIDQQLFPDHEGES